MGTAHHTAQVSSSLFLNDSVNFPKKYTKFVQKFDNIHRCHRQKL